VLDRIAQQGGTAGNERKGAVMNTWPNGHRHAMTQTEHENWNARCYPGTLQLCSECDDPTGRCEDDSLYADEDGEIGPLCEACWKERWAADERGRYDITGVSQGRKGGGMMDEDGAL